MQASEARESITGLVLAGGRSRRMAGADKGLLEIGGRPMVEYVLDAIVPQVGPLLVNANRNLERYAGYGYRVVPDTREGYLGPLAGVLSALAVLETEYLLAVPCDSPLLARDLGERLLAALLERRADVAVAHDGRRRQPAFLLLRRGLEADLGEYLDGGGRSIDGWLARCRIADTDLSDRPECFVNVNDPAERACAEALLHSKVAAP